MVWGFDVMMVMVMVMMVMGFLVNDGEDGWWWWWLLRVLALVDSDNMQAKKESVLVRLVWTMKHFLGSLDHKYEKP